MSSEDLVIRYALLKGNDTILNDLNSCKEITNQLVRMISENLTKINEGDDVETRKILLYGLRLQIKESNAYIASLIDFLKEDINPENEEGRTKSLRFLEKLLEEEKRKESY